MLAIHFFFVLSVNMLLGGGGVFTILLYIAVLDSEQPLVMLHTTNSASYSDCVLVSQQNSKTLFRKW